MTSRFYSLRIFNLTPFHAEEKLAMIRCLKNTPSRHVALAEFGGGQNWNNIPGS
jgi:hypothetical protein